MVESLRADAGGMGSCPGLGGSHVLPSGWAREPWTLSLCVRSLCSATGEATAVRRPCTAKTKQNIKDGAVTELLEEDGKRTTLSMPAAIIY